MTIHYEQGQRFDNTKLTFICEVDRTNPKERRALFQCNCGNQIELNICWVRHLNTISCGCFKKEIMTEKSTIHGHASRKEKSGSYRSWQAMHQRVRCKLDYKDRIICERWSGKDGFKNFYSDMGDRPEGLSIERIDNSKGYEPNNCKWATSLEQNNNRYNSKRNQS